MLEIERLGDVHHVLEGIIMDSALKAIDSLNDVSEQRYMVLCVATMYIFCSINNLVK